MFLKCFSHCKGRHDKNYIKSLTYVSEVFFFLLLEPVVYVRSYEVILLIDLRKHLTAQRLLCYIFRCYIVFVPIDVQNTYCN